MKRLFKRIAIGSIVIISSLLLVREGMKIGYQLVEDIKTEAVEEYKAEEKELGVGTVMSFSNKGLGDFFNDRINTIESWKDEGYISAEIDYVYEDDEVNVSEACDVTIFSFAKAFSCMMPRAA